MKIIDINDKERDVKEETDALKKKSEKKYKVKLEDGSYVTLDLSELGELEVEV